MLTWIQQMIESRRFGFTGHTITPSRKPRRELIRIAAVIGAEEHRFKFQEIAREFGWAAYVAESWAEAIPMLDTKRPPILIYDRDLPEIEWRTALLDLIARHHGICILLASTVMDQYLWNEVILHGGYDVVLKPFRAESLNRTVTFASTGMELSARTEARSSRIHK